MKHTYTSLCTAALLMLAACTNDPAEDLLSSNDTRPDALPEGTFVVDYLPSADLPATRGLGDDEVILSLDYLLYASKDDQEYTLQKHTSISDINAKTPWPLTRDNMTWQQRQELKDTLNTNSQYKVVFVANADKKVWHDYFQPMTGVDDNANFDDARLLLPPNGDFRQTDDSYTFYYMWTGEIDPIMNKYDKNTPAQMDVVLQRMVNKVEVKLANEVVEGIETNTDADTYISTLLTNFYDKYYSNNDNNGQLDNIVSNYISNFESSLETANVGVKKDDTEKFKKDYLQPTEKKKAFVNHINTEIKADFIEQMKPLFMCDWEDINKIEIIYAASSYPHAINFDKETKTKETNEEKTIGELDETGHFIFYTFRNVTSTEINKISSINFLNNEGTSAFTISNINTIPGGQITDGNRHFLLIYNPTEDENMQIQTVNESNNNTYFAYKKENNNLQTILNWQWSDFKLNGVQGVWKGQEDMEEWLNKGLKDADISGTYNNMTIELNIPKIKIVNPWSTEVAGQSATTE